MSKEPYTGGSQRKGEERGEVRVGAVWQRRGEKREIKRKKKHRVIHNERK